MNDDLSPPQSPFEPRPAAPSTPPPGSTAPSSAPEVKDGGAGPAAPPAAEGPSSAKPLPVEWPLTSFSSTPHNVAAIAFVLGTCWSLGAVLLALNASTWFAWTAQGLKSHVESLPQGVWYAATHSSQLGFYLACWSFFHLAEFVVTSMYNPGKLSVSCKVVSSYLSRGVSVRADNGPASAAYLLDNGQLYHVAHCAGILEHVLEDAFLPAEYRRWKHSGGLFLVGASPAVANPRFAPAHPSRREIRRRRPHRCWPVAPLVRHDQRE